MIQRATPFLVFIVIMLAFGLAAGFISQPGAWYVGLNKPWFTPPDQVFLPVWLLLYTLIGIAGGAIYRWDPQSRAVKWWFNQLVLNVVWSIVFFRFQMPGAALLIIILLLFSIIFLMRSTRGEVPLAVWCLSPYLLWVTFAALLNAGIVSLN